MNLEDLSIEKELKIVYMGTPEFSRVVLEGLLTKYKVRAIVTQPDRPVGRDGEIKFSEVKKCAMEHTILAIQPENIKKQYEEIIAFAPDLIITCAYGQIIPKELLDCPRLGCINVHASLLPKLRGGAPIQKAIIDGHSKTGVTIMYMDEKMDTGDMIAQRELEISYDDTASSLHDKLSIIGRDLLLEVLPSIIDGTNNRIKQDELLATYAKTIQRADERLAFNKTKRQIYNQVRGLYSWPGSYAIFDGKIMKVWKCRETDNTYSGLLNGTITNIYEDGFGVKVDNGEVVFTEIQLEGKKRISGKDYVNGHKDLVGKIFE
ncbi:MAG TPA: methionyl-tRNA formyltransferase [Bacilli bacterium]|nr:methionyl-tRNA formyltransferase [Bacilli bacterium]